MQWKVGSMIRTRRQNLNLSGRAARVGELAVAVRSRREQLDLRQAELAELAGVSERFVHAVESAKPTLQLDKLIDVLAALGLHLQLVRGARLDIVTSIGPPAGKPGT
jgi:HTH-type transcriptional regulator/antitoxin HipB